MTALSTILRLAAGNRLHFWCPGCDAPHGVGFGEGHGPRWEWNGDAVRPTFRPSVLVNRGQANPAAPICHFYITDGKILFLHDCTHALAGKTVDLPEWGG